MKKRIILFFESFKKEVLDKLKEDNKTYIKKWRNHSILQQNKFVIYLNSLKEINYSNFVYNQTPYSITIYPSKEFMYIYYEICNVTGFNYNPNLNFQLSIDKTDMNRIDFIPGIPEVIQGAGVALNLYLLVIKHNGYITSMLGVNELAINLWYNLLQNNSIYGMTNNKISVAIDKSISDDKLEQILNFLPKDLEIDEELEEKIIKIYGSLDAYSQRK